MTNIPDLGQTGKFAATYDWSAYTVLDLLRTGGRFTIGFDQNAAVELYLRVHPGAVESEVRAELARLLVEAGLPATFGNES